MNAMTNAPGEPKANNKSNADHAKAKPARKAAAKSTPEFDRTPENTRAAPRMRGKFGTSGTKNNWKLAKKLRAGLQKTWREHFGAI